jgi:Leucine-rich repeat (LRR) protein
MEINHLNNLPLLNLDFSNNPIGVIKNIDTLSNLQILHLKQCKLLEISGLDNLSALKILDLQKNQIRIVNNI